MGRDEFDVADRLRLLWLDGQAQQQLVRVGQARRFSSSARAASLSKPALEILAGRFLQRVFVGRILVDLVRLAQPGQVGREVAGIARFVETGGGLHLVKQLFARRRLQVLSERPKPHVGRVWADRDIRKAFESAVTAAKLDDLHFHDLRHTFASYFVMRGGSLQGLKELLGHADLKLTLRYAHLSQRHLRAEIDKTAGVSCLETLPRPLSHQGVERR